MEKPGKLVGVDEMVSGLERLGESPKVANPLNIYNYNVYNILYPSPEGDQPSQAVSSSCSCHLANVWSATHPALAITMSSCASSRVSHYYLVYYPPLPGSSCKTLLPPVTRMVTEASIGRSLKALPTFSLLLIGLGLQDASGTFANV